MNSFSLGFLLVIIPTVFQLVCGRRSILGKSRLRFEWVCTLAVLAQLLSIFGAVELILNELEGRRHCGMPAAAMTFLGLAMSLVLLIVVISQFLWRKSRKPI